MQARRQQPGRHIAQGGQQDRRRRAIRAHVRLVIGDQGLHAGTQEKINHENRGADPHRTGKMQQQRGSHKDDRRRQRRQHFQEDCRRDQLSVAALVASERPQAHRVDPKDGDHPNDLRRCQDQGERPELNLGQGSIRQQEDDKRGKFPGNARDRQGAGVAAHVLEERAERKGARRRAGRRVNLHVQPQACLS